jgi:hypothetical protein
MITLTEKEWRKIPKSIKRKTPLTGLRQFLYKSTGGMADVWITETVNFIISDKEGS